MTEHSHREKLSYDQIAGRSVERLAALSDGVFAVAMTLLILDLHAPAAELVHSEQDLWRALVALAPRLVMYLMSFMTLGIFWVGQQTQLNHLERSSRSLTWIHLAFLLEVTIVPFSTALLAEHTQYRIALLVYWVNYSVARVDSLLELGMRSRQQSRQQRHPRSPFAGDQASHCDRSVFIRIERSAVFLQSYWSIALFILVQLNYVIAPRFGRQREE